MHKGIPRNYNLQNLPKETVMHKQVNDKEVKQSTQINVRDPLILTSEGEG